MSVCSGTFESELCPDQNFLCGDPDDIFDRCMHAIDCKMNYEMRVEKVKTNDGPIGRHEAIVFVFVFVMTFFFMTECTTAKTSCTTLIGR